jgi:hypothetical protein
MMMCGREDHGVEHMLMRHTVLTHVLLKVQELSETRQRVAK